VKARSVNGIRRAGRLYCACPASPPIVAVLDPVHLLHNTKGWVGTFLAPLGPLGLRLREDQLSYVFPRIRGVALLPAERTVSWTGSLQTLAQ
jgi:hypothetical protein